MSPIWTCSGLLVLCSLWFRVCVGQFPVVCLKQDGSECLRGVERGTWKNVSFESFMGIPYAKPPVGELRFANPVPNDPWTGVYDATQPKDSCIQLNDFIPLAEVFGTEDCLYLNVYKPKNVREPIPVMMFLHGGGFTSGTASPLVYGPEKLMNSNQPVILVTFQYRLGVFGFLSTGDSNSPGNYAFKDQAMALRWVNSNIHRFGGDPNRITLFGNSAGAASAQLHMMSPLSRGLFSRAILMSGSALSYWVNPDQDPMSTARLQISALGVSPADTLNSKQVVDILRSATSDYLIESIKVMKQAVGIQNSVAIFRPVIEQFVANESFISEDPRAVWAEGSYDQIPWMAGLVQNEGIVFTIEAFKFMADPIAWAQFSAAAPYLIPRLVGLDETKAAALKDRFFGGSTRSEWLTPATIFQLARMIGEAAFVYPTQRSIQSHLRKANLERAPVSMYQFDFRGPNSLSYYYMNFSTQNVGAAHADDTLYLFDQPILFPPFRRESPAWVISQRFVDFFTDFAHARSEYTCTSEDKCSAVRFANSVGTDDPANISAINGLNSELLSFWDSMFKLQ